MNPPEEAGDVLFEAGKDGRGLRITRAFLIQILVTAMLMGGTYFAMQMKIDNATRQSEENARKLEVASEQLQTMRSDIRSIRESLEWFRAKYEEDFNRYIREPERRRQ